MSDRGARRLAWGLAGLAFVLFASGEALSIAAIGLGERDAIDFVYAVLVVVFSGLGGLLASRLPRNPIGWIFCGVAVATGLAILSHGYAEFWLAGNPASETLGETGASYGSASWIPFVLVPATFPLLLFPDGRLLSRRWRIIGWCAALGIAGTFVVQVLGHPRLEDYPQLANPYLVESPIFEPLEGLSGLLAAIGLVGSALSLIVRFRRAGREQRQQIKWLATAGAVTGVTILVGIPLSQISETVAYSAIMLSVAGLPVAIGIAILRHRLYDIDVVINRTVVYGALTASLAATYLASVLMLQLALGGLTEDSGLAVAGSTLAVAAAFRPARDRIQAAVDRRFFRRKYDAARTLQLFGTRLRDEVDLELLGDELRGVVAETMQPASVSLWLRTPGTSRG